MRIRNLCTSDEEKNDKNERKIVTKEAFQHQLLHIITIDE
jgi:hypothetical protein